MNKSLKDLIKQASVEPEQDLNRKILICINQRNQRNNTIKMCLFSILCVSSVVVFIPTIKLLMSEFSSSGLYEYSSLVFSHSSSMAVLGKEFLLIIAESIPVLSITLTLGVVFIFILSIKKIVEQVIKNQLTLAI